MMLTALKRKLRARRHTRVRSRISGVSSRPRVVVFKSARHIFVQAVDDTTHKTLVGSGDFDTKMKLSARAPKKLGTKIKRAFTVGEHIAEELRKSKIVAVVFDRGGFKYHGRVKAVADGLRAAGIHV